MDVGPVPDGLLPARPIPMAGLEWLSRATCPECGELVDAVCLFVMPSTEGRQPWEPHVHPDEIRWFHLAPCGHRLAVLSLRFTVDRSEIGFVHVDKILELWAGARSIFNGDESLGLGGAPAPGN